MSLLGKPIEEVIETLYNSIKSKRQIITNIKREYTIDDDSFNDIKINRFKLIDLLDEFEVTISQSLQAIQTFKVEIFNLKEKQTTEEILNLTNEFQMKYNSNSTNNLNNNNNILDKIENNKTENSIIKPKNEKNNSVQNNILNDDLERDGKNEIIKGKNQKENIEAKYKKEFDALKEAKLNFDYSSLLNNSQTSLKSSISNLDKFRLDNNKSANNQNQNREINTHINKNNFNQKNTPNLLKENNDIDIVTNNLNKEDIEEEQPSKLNINIIRSNNDIVNKMKLIEKNESNKDISCFSENMEYNTSNNTDNFNINKFYSMRQSEIPGLNNINSNQSFNYKFNLLNSDSNPNIIENEKINNNFEESDIISLVSKNDIIKEKFQKLENEEKINKLIEEIFSIKAFKLYILDKFGNGKQDIFFKKVKNGEINKDELESELNILKEINNSNNDNNLYLTETKNRKKNNKGLNKIMSDTDINNINFNTENIETNFAQTDKNNIYKKINKKKNIIKEESKNRNPSNIKNNLRDNYKNNAINISNNTNSYSNKNKNISSHSVSSIRAKIKSKKF
jgi:hypothetical protein